MKLPHMNQAGLMTLFSLLMLPAGMSARAEVTAEPLFQATEDDLGQPLNYFDGAPAEITALVVSMEPGDSTDWHQHPVPTMGYLLSGELTVEYESGRLRVFHQGEGIMESMHERHKGHNAGTETVRIAVFHAGSPGQPVTVTTDAPDTATSPAP